MGPSRLGWYWRRLQSMPPAELPHRVREAWRQRVDREGAWLAEVDRELAPHRVVVPPSWPLGPALHGELAGRDAGSLARDAEALLRGPAFELLGRSWPLERRRAWGWDPETGERWPQERFAWEVDFRHEAGGRDVKVAWELLRLQHLQLLAHAARAGDGAAKEAVLQDLDDFLSACEPGQGIGWASGIEVAQRVASLLVISGLLGPDQLRGPLRARLWRELAAAGAWLARYPSLHSSANNHRVAELGALWLLGCLAPALPWARAWRREARQGLAREAALQIHPDGVGDEQTPTYQAFTVEWLLVSAVVGRRVAQRLGPEVDDRLAASARFLGTLLGPGGHHPRFGDEDEGVVLRRSLAPEDYVRSVVGAVACWLERGALVPEGWAPDLRSGLLGLSRPPGGRAARSSRHFPQGGHTWLHAEDEGGRTELLFDHAPLGFRWTAGHGHADALAIWLRRDGVPILVDSGTYRYNGQPEWRAWMRSTAAHNTVEVDGRSQSETAGPFNWGRRARCTLEELELTPGGGGVVSASHDGYQPLGVVHRRRVELLDAGRVRVVDELEGSGTHEVALRWLLAPELEAHEGPEGATDLVRDGVLVARLRVSGAPLVLSLHRQAEGAGEGVLSPAYNVRRATTCLAWTARVALPLRQVSELTFFPVSSGGAAASEPSAGQGPPV